MKLNVLPSKPPLGTLDTYLLAQQAKLGQSVNPQDDVIFNKIYTTGDLTVSGDIKSTGLIVGNIVNTSGSGISVSRPTLVTEVVSGTSGLTQTVSNLLVVSASFATLDCSFTFVNDLDTFYVVFNLFLPGVNTFTSQTLREFASNITLQTEDGITTDQVTCVAVQGRRCLQISCLVNNGVPTGAEYTISVKVGYSFIPSPNTYSFNFFNLTAGLSNIVPYLNYLITTIDNNQIQLSLDVTCSRALNFESFDIELPNRTTAFTGKGQVVGVVQGRSDSSGLPVDSVSVVSVPGTVSARVSFAGVADVIQMEMFVTYVGT